MGKTKILNIHQFHEHDAPEDFYANTLQEHLRTRHKDIALPHKHDFYLAVLFTRGSGIHEVDFASYPVQTGALFFLNPGQTHHWKLSDDTEGYIFFHTQPFYELHYSHSRLAQYPFFYSACNTPIVKLNIIETSNIAGLFEAILEEASKARPFRHQAILSLIDQVYIAASRLYPEPSAIVNAESNYYEKFRRLEQLVGEFYSTEKSPSAYAAMLHISPKHLNRITQAMVGKTAGDVILDRVLLEARRELVLQRCSLAQIAQMLGYEDYAYFSRLFKKKTGETPSAFVKRYIR